MKVYIVTSDFGIEGVYSSVEKAFAYCEKHASKLEVDEKQATYELVVSELKEFEEVLFTTPSYDSLAIEMHILD